MLSRTAKSGVKLEIVMTIPKQCNIADRPVGYQVECLENLKAISFDGSCTSLVPSARERERERNYGREREKEGERGREEKRRRRFGFCRKHNAGGDYG
ncbi:hypothetical protein HanRHA438_Chr01g0029291 [Helianthus annuus]|uniref:Uncharacterized protein n=1 Tax=Helianthus annuus TaxID=4232 RepID=A0A9K3JWI7_HELAN|nr:hypothetical protein HanXRQr2_Chr01g0028811 [Helianthus annuus]KAJ0612085.1 hypothetical protein HanHA300_Chr01g0023191 [Helianthus annuus]KAJ0627438.1 hypothetical protein HanHA89_Chr01g0025371 [Helianthus annuus]KAJ0783753.1 hypothetical protein HanLR1_Chr01g0024041 [Helianthus annuus]KAJ0948618.1 hypothetical protein HanRHA438_Chr01g0029291 [Helianthus annuus]